MANDLTLDQIEQSKKIFEKYRIQDDKPLEEAIMSIEELFPAMMELNFEISLNEIKEIIKKIKINEYIDFSTFVRICAIKFRERDFSIEVLNAFKSFDRTNKDYLTYEELKGIITDYGPKISSEAADNLMKELGLEQNKKFLYGDFINFNL